MNAGIKSIPANLFIKANSGIADAYAPLFFALLVSESLDSATLTKAAFQASRPIRCEGRDIL